ncbi:MAG: hypothetical protein FJY07_02440 [Bacteroidetes bacterium]|nr:hypothetical protein [Bacteroidota bacterium]
MQILLPPVCLWVFIMMRFEFTSKRYLWHNRKTTRLQAPRGENNLFLMVYNPDTSTAGSYEVRIVTE